MTAAAPGTEAPVRCACGNVPNVCSLPGVWWVECAYCRRRPSGRCTTRATALREWADQTRGLLDKIIHGRA